ncbi:MAG: hypothetical protein ACI4PQ_01980 [Butyricicoccaceae bacterium]
MEPVPLGNTGQGEVMLRVHEASELETIEPGQCAGVIVDNLELLATAKRRLTCSVGILLRAQDAVGEDVESHDWTPNLLIDSFKPQVRAAVRGDADFIYVRDAGNFRALRAAVLAITDISDICILTELRVADDEGRMSDNVSVLGALGVLQRIGVAGMLLRGDNAGELAETLAEIAPYAHISIGLCTNAAEVLEHSEELPNLEFFVTSRLDQLEPLRRAMPRLEEKNEPEEDPDYFLASDGNHVHFIDATIDISDPIDLTEQFGETLLDMEDEYSGAVKLEISSQEDIYFLAAYQYMLTRAVCISAEDPELMETALRVFNGIAIYDGTWEIDPERLAYFRSKYGLIIL